MHLPCGKARQFRENVSFIQLYPLFPQPGWGLPESGPEKALLGLRTGAPWWLQATGQLGSRLAQG